MAEKQHVWHLGFKTKLNPTPEQAHYFACACGVARFSYNWGARSVEKTVSGTQGES